MKRIWFRGARVIDGTGRAGFAANVLVCGDAVAEVTQRAPDGPEAEIIDATGRTLCPGLIDLHTHADYQVLDRAGDEVKLRQGVTTVIVGNCGFSAAPVGAGYAAETRRYVASVMNPPPGVVFNTYAEYFAALRRAPLGVNVGVLAGNGSIRMAVKGFSPDALSHDEMEAVTGHLQAAMEEGAFGLSMGLLYAPENAYTSGELAHIAKTLKPYGGMLTTHIRGEADGLVASVDEVIEIARKAGVPLHISHLKAAGRNNWGKALPAVLAHIERAVGEGADITADAYAYTAGSTLMTTLLPPAALSGGIEGLLASLRDPVNRRAIADAVSAPGDGWDNIVFSTGWEAVVVTSLKNPRLRPCIGRSIADIARERGADPAETALDLIGEEGDNILIVFHHMDAADMRAALRWRGCMAASDSLYAEGLPHPRMYGNFPRFLSMAIREGWMTLEQAVHKCTEQPARRLGLADRGCVKRGYKADLVLFDPETLRDTATYRRPRSFPEGIDTVMINGVLAWHEGRMRDERRGTLLMRGMPGKAQTHNANL